MTAVQNLDAMTLRAPSASGRVLDVAGVVLWIAAALWAGFTASSRTGAAAVQALLAAAATCFVVGSLVARWGRWIVPAAITTVVAVLLILAPAQMLSGKPLSGPFGYSNATGALYAQGVATALTLTVAVRSRPATVIGVLATAAFVTVPFVIGSQVAALVTIGFMVAALAARNPTSTRAIVLLCAALAAGALVFTFAIGATYEPENSPRTLDRLVTRTLGERRPALWHDAWTIMASRPMTGAGSGSFATASPVARSDKDARWAHNEFLEQGAEAGIPGLALTALIFAWALAKIMTAQHQDAVTALAACAVTALAIHACVDYVLHFPAVPALTAALVGSATGAARSAFRMESH